MRLQQQLQEYQAVGWRVGAGWLLNAATAAFVAAAGIECQLGIARCQNDGVVSERVLLSAGIKWSLIGISTGFKL